MSAMATFLKTYARASLLRHHVILRNGNRVEGGLWETEKLVAHCSVLHPYTLRDRQYACILCIHRSAFLCG